MELNSLNEKGQFSRRSATDAKHRFASARPFLCTTTARKGRKPRKIPPLRHWLKFHSRSPRRLLAFQSCAPVGRHRVRHALSLARAHLGPGRSLARSLRNRPANTGADAGKAKSFFFFFFAVSQGGAAMPRLPCTYEKGVFCAAVCLAGTPHLSYATGASPQIFSLFFPRD